MPVNDADGAGLAVRVGLLFEQNWSFRVVRLINIDTLASPSDEHVVGEFGTRVGKLGEIGLLLFAFSQERLERFLNSLDMDVRIRVGPRAAGKKHANVTVELVAAF